MDLEDAREREKRMRPGVRKPHKFCIWVTSAP